MRCRLAILLLALRGTCFAQPGEFLSLRYDEDHRLLPDSLAAPHRASLKHRPLGAKADHYLSMGGEFRYQVQHFVNEDWGASPVTAYTAIYTRLLYHFDLHLGPARFFGQLNSTLAEGRPTPDRPIDENLFDVQQVFFDARFADNKLLVRLGRQELLYGSQRLIAVREGPNNRQSFDAVKAVMNLGRTQLDLFYGHPVRVRQGILDDRFNDIDRVWSAYAVIGGAQGLPNLDLYYIGFNGLRGYADGSGTELRHSVGTRIWRKYKRWMLDAEALYQFGECANARIAAYTASIHASYTFTERKGKPSLGIKSETISGDRRTGDGQLNTFNPLYPRGAYFGLAALVGPANLLDAHPTFGVCVGRHVRLNGDVDLFWRYSTADGIYGPNAVLLQPAVGGERYIGDQYGFNAEWTPNRHWTVVPEFTYFHAGPYLQDASPGEDVYFGAITVQLKY